MKHITTTALVCLGVLLGVGASAIASNAKPQLEVVPVKVATYNATMNYLAQRPYAEVYQLLAALNADGEAANRQLEAKEKPKAEAPKK